MHGPVPSLLRGHHRGRHLRQHEDRRALAHGHRHRLQSQVSRVRPRPGRLHRAGLQRPKGKREGTRRETNRLRSPPLLARAPLPRPARSQHAGHHVARRLRQRARSRGDRESARRSSSSTRRRRLLEPLPDTPFDTDDVEGHGRHQDLPRHLRPQQVLGPLAALVASRSSSVPTTTSSPSFSGPSRSPSTLAAGASARTSSILRTRRLCSSTSLAPPLARCPPRSPRSAETGTHLLQAPRRGVSIHPSRDRPTHPPRRVVRRHRRRQRDRRGHADRPRRRRVRRVRLAPQAWARSRIRIPFASATTRSTPSRCPSPTCPSMTGSRPRA